MGRDGGTIMLPALGFCIGPAMPRPWNSRCRLCCWNMDLISSEIEAIAGRMASRTAFWQSPRMVVESDWFRASVSRAMAALTRDWISSQIPGGRICGDQGQDSDIVLALPCG